MQWKINSTALIWRFIWLWCCMNYYDFWGEEEDLGQDRIYWFWVRLYLFTFWHCIIHLFVNLSELYISLDHMMQTWFCGLVLSDVSVVMKVFSVYLHDVYVGLLGYIWIIVERRIGHTSCTKCFNSSLDFAPGFLQRNCQHRKWIY